jgi:cell shape-determining protein MreD
MNWQRTLLVLMVTFLAVFVQAALNAPRQWLGAQVNVLPPLMVYCAVNSEVGTLGLVAVCGGLWSDALSANPLGISVLPLFWLGLGLHRWRDVLLRELAYAQFVLGLAASAAVPVATVLLLLTAGERPLVGWGSLWQLAVVSVGGAALTPVFFWLLERLARWFAYPPAGWVSFRPDREIKRGPF